MVLDGTNASRFAKDAEGQDSLRHALADNLDFISHWRNVTLVSFTDVARRRLTEGRRLSASGVTATFEVDVESTLDATTLTSMLKSELESALSSTDDGANDCGIAVSFTSYLTDDDGGVVFDCAASYADIDTLDIVMAPTPAPTASPKNSNKNNTDASVTIGASVAASFLFVLLVVFLLYRFREKVPAASEFLIYSRTDSFRDGDLDDVEMAQASGSTITKVEESAQAIDAELEEFLHGVGLARFLPKFVDYGVWNIADLSDERVVSDSDLQEHIGMRPGHIRKLKASLAEYWENRSLSREKEESELRRAQMENPISAERLII